MRWGLDKTTGKQFIRVRNSCGQGWGDWGYAKVEYLPNSILNTCHILSLAYQPILK